MRLCSLESLRHHRSCFSQFLSLPASLSPLALPSFLKHDWSHSSPGNMRVMILPYCSAKGLYSFPLFIMDRPPFAGQLVSKPGPTDTSHSLAIWCHMHRFWLSGCAFSSVTKISLSYLVSVGSELSSVLVLWFWECFFSRLHVYSVEGIDLGR